jgi:hypothetical protein
MRRGVAAFLLLLTCLAAANDTKGRALAALEPDDLYASVGPAIALVQTTAASGSGILVDPEHVLTNAHVVGPFEEVRVRFPGGAEFQGARVVAWDRLTDMALVRIPRVDISPVRVGDATALRAGSRLYLIGYPGERDDEPQPTIMQGLLSRFRRGGPAEVNYVQTDAQATAGNSGGAMISAAGDVIAVSQFRFPGTNFTLGASLAEVLPRLRALASGDRKDPLGDRRYSALAAPIVMPFAFTLEGVYADQAFLVRPGNARSVTIEVQGVAARLDAYDVRGAHVDNGIPIGPGRLVMRLLAEAAQPYLVVVRQARFGLNQFIVTADETMASLGDPDRGALLGIGTPQMGALAYLNARQYFFLDLIEGQSVAITAESVAIDSFLAIDRPGNEDGPLAIDDDSGAGLLGHDAVVRYTATATGRYLVSVRDVAGLRTGAYVLTAHAAAPPASSQGSGAILGGTVGREGPQLIVFGGGEDDDLVAATLCPSAALRVWAADGAGQMVVFVPGAAVREVNAAWRALFRFGIPEGTSLLVWCDLRI